MVIVQGENMQSPIQRSIMLSWITQQQNPLYLSFRKKTKNRVTDNLQAVVISGFGYVGMYTLTFSLSIMYTRDVGRLKHNRRLVLSLVAGDESSSSRIE